MTIRETILRVKSGKTKALLLSGISAVEGFRSEALRLNKELREKGVKTVDGKPPYTISKNSYTGYMYIINNIIEE